MNNIQLAVFDLAGTTIKDDGYVAEAFSKALSALNIQVPVSELNIYMGYRKREAIGMILDKYQPDMSQDASVADKLETSFVDHMIRFYSETEKLTVLPGVYQVFEYLRSKEIKIGINTGFSANITSIILNRLGWIENGWIDAAISSDEVEKGRPEPFMIQSLMRQTGVESAARVIKTGDTSVDIQEGKNAGCLCTIAVTSGAFSREALAAFDPSFIIDDITDLITILEDLNQN